MVGQRLAVLFFFHYVDATAAVRGVSLAPRELPSLSIIYFFYPAEHPHSGFFTFYPAGLFCCQPFAPRKPCPSLHADCTPAVHH